MSIYGVYEYLFSSWGLDYVLEMRPQTSNVSSIMYSASDMMDVHPSPHKHMPPGGRVPFSVFINYINTV